MSFVALSREAKMLKLIRVPGIPAPPRNSAHSDHSHAALTPTEIKVSIVAAPWRTLVKAARWNGNAPQTTTGEARVRASHCQLSNCHAGTIDISSTGRLRTAEITSRCRSRETSSSLSSCPVPTDPATALWTFGTGSAALYPVASTVATRSCGETVPELSLIHISEPT